VIDLVTDWSRIHVENNAQAHGTAEQRIASTAYLLEAPAEMDE
jgi:hypothetical protein